jgi:hypothetical protein
MASSNWSPARVKASSSNSTGTEWELATKNHRLEVFDATDHISGCIANHVVRQEAKMGSLTNKPGVDTMDPDA